MSQPSNRISRKDLFRGAGATGVMLTVPAFLQHCGYTEGRLDGDDDQDPIANARAAGLETPALIAINCGITAPNPHNTQAWKFRLNGSESFDLFVDEERILPFTDPPARQVHIGQGTFLEHAAIGARELGYEPTITLFPEGPYDLAAIGTKPVARVTLTKSAAVKKDPLYAQIAKRATNRTAYDGPAITAAEFERIKSGVGAGHSRLEFVGKDKSARMDALTEIFHKAMAIEVGTESRGEESRVWFRLSDDDIYSKRDGISLRGGGFSGFMLWLVRTFFISLDKEKFHSKESQDAYLGPFLDKLKSSKAYIFWRTATNTPRDWVLTGRDYARLQLVLTGMGLVMHPLSQVLQEYPEMDDLRQDFEKLMQQAPPEKVQMLVRVGRSDYRFFAPRRPAGDMIMK